mmetsp:Transcript_28095/g.80735  ORF Transcript_28095/g.80735 Transcript_28095/m.80735 type:complete len:216 (+) Transcript_28095:147-794(+)
MPGNCKANARVGMVVDRVVPLQKWDAKDEQRTARRRNIKLHQSQPARASVLVGVILWRQRQDPTADDEAQFRQLMKIGAVRGHIQGLPELLHYLGGASELRSAGIDRDPAVRADVLGFAVDRDIVDLHLPVADLARDWHPKQLRRHVFLFHRTERDLRLLRIGVGEENREQGAAQRRRIQQTAHQAEVLALRHFRQGEAEHAVEGEGRKRLFRLI